MFTSDEAVRSVILSVRASDIRYRHDPKMMTREMLEHMVHHAGKIFHHVNQVLSRTEIIHASEVEICTKMVDIFAGTGELQRPLPPVLQFAEEDAGPLSQILQYEDDKGDVSDATTVGVHQRTAMHSPVIEDAAAARMRFPGLTPMELAPVEIVDVYSEEEEEEVVLMAPPRTAVRDATWAAPGRKRLLSTEAKERYAARRRVRIEAKRFREACPAYDNDAETQAE